MRTGNPTLSEHVFVNEAQNNSVASKTMTIQGTVNKSAFLLMLLVTTAALTWQIAMSASTTMTETGQVIPNVGVITPMLIGGAVIGLIAVLVSVFNKKISAITAPIYALAEGCFIGGISCIAESMFPGIVMQATALTFGVFFGLLSAYKSGLIKATENFKLGVAAATLGIFALYMVSFVMSFFGTSVPYIHESGLMGIGFSLFVVVIAALNLVLDFDFIENGEEVGAPKYMEWYASLGLLTTLVWLYIEILRLLIKLNSRD